jgi:hypothetical protein
MISRKPLVPDRVRRIGGRSFAFLHHRFLQDGFFASLTHQERSLYLFLVLAADRSGVSFYAYDRICSVLDMTLDEYIDARNALIDKDLLAFDGRRFQVLELPAEPSRLPTRLLRTDADFENHDPATVHRLAEDTFGDEGARR